MKPEQLTGLVDQYGGALYRFCRKLTPSPADADDLYQETFLRAVEQCQKIDESKNPQGYLIGIALHLWRGQRRKWARRQRIAPQTSWQEDFGPADLLDGPEESLLQQELTRLVAEVVASLDDKFRLPLYLTYTLELPQEESAAILRIPLGTLKSRLHKARKLVKKRLEAILDERPEGYSGLVPRESPFLNRFGG